MISGLHDVQGYNPIHLARYDEYMTALNGRPQDYHHADVFEQGLTSPLLDLLNARYVIVPAVTAPDQTALRPGPAYRTVYEDDRARVLANPDALPRAWIVHGARQVGPGQALELLASGTVDPRLVALLEGPPPSLAQPDDASADEAVITMYDADRIELRTKTEAPGLLVLSEVYYPAWKAYVDDDPAVLYLADHVLRGVPVPAGEHRVELRYESPALLAGMVISPGTCGILLALAIAAWVQRGEGTCSVMPTAAC
jgi:Bacterial membrane protein YfhO